MDVTLPIGQKVALAERTAAFPRHMNSLDGIRGIAVLSVLCFHFGDLSKFSSLGLRVIGSVKDAGWLGVDIFFALSGFLITGILLSSRVTPPPPAQGTFMSEGRFGFFRCSTQFGYFWRFIYGHM